MKIRRTQTARKTGILATALAIGLLSSTAVAAEKPWTEEEVASGVRKQEFVRYAFAGREMNLEFTGMLNEDCSEATGWVFEIIKPPGHGVADIVPHNAAPFYMKDNPRSKCDQHKINAQMLVYKADDGYKGPDSFTFLVISPSGLAWEKTFHFNVRAITKPKSAQRS